MGEVFAGRYELVDLVGEGGMGSVWRVWDSRERRLVAAKVLRQSDAVSLLRFVREQALRVQHPHVLTPLGWAGEDDRVLFTMPVVDGGSVATLVGDHGPLPPLLVAELLRQLLDALGAVHGAGILHRDVKPANLLLLATGTGRPHLYLTDFGIAVDLDGPRFTQTGEWSGTPGYLAPEVTTGAEPDPTSDLYAVGRVGQAMLTGRRPGEVVDPPTVVPSSLWDLLADLTAPDPGARPATAHAARERLQVPELAWRAGALGDVEVLQQIADPPPGVAQVLAPSVDDDATRVRVGPERVSPGPGELGTGERGGAGRAGGDTDEVATVTPAALDVAAPAGRLVMADPVGERPRSRGPVVAALLVLAVLVVALLVWSPWDDVVAGSGQGQETDPTPGVTSPSQPGTPTSAPTSAPSTSTTTAPTTPSPTTSGGVDVGTVVVRVGQPCTFSEVGVPEETVDGEPVVCRRRADGSYAWDPPPG